MANEKIENKLEEIVDEILNLDFKDVAFTPKELEFRERQFRVGSQFMRDKNMNDRIKVGQTIRVIERLYKTPEQREAYVRAAMPAMLPVLKSRPE